MSLISDTGGSSLDELLQILSDTNNYAVKVKPKDKPLTVEDILNKPFYTVEDDPTEDLYQPLNGYRNTLSDLLLNVRIKSPERLQNQTLLEHLARIDWTDQELIMAFEAALNRGSHNSLCLAHGRNPLIKYKEISYPSFRSFRPKSNICNSRLESKSSRFPLPVLNNKALKTAQEGFIVIVSTIFVAILM